MLKMIAKISARLGYIAFILIIFYLLTADMFIKEIEKISFLKDYRPSTTSCLYDNKLQKIKEISWEKRYFTRINKVPKKLIEAFLSAEDKHFFSHPGLDLFGMTRAVFENTLKNSWGKKPIGASTITQQVAKNIVVGNKHSFERKVSEALTAISMEYALSKNRILELYLNEIFLGRKSYGIVSAANTYFNKPLSELTLSEYAYLAILPKAPANYDISKNKKKVLERKNWVIKRMHEDGYITKEEALSAIKDELNSIIPVSHTQSELDYFSEQIRRDLLQNFGEQYVYGEGLHIKSTQDATLQNIAENTLKDHLLFLDKQQGYQGALVQLDLSQEKTVPTTADAWKKSDLLCTLKNLPDLPGTKKWLMVMVLKTNSRESDPILLGTKSGDILKLYTQGFAWAKKSNKKENEPLFNQGDVILVEEKKGKIFLQQVPEITGGILVIDPQTGAILAMSGGYDATVSHFNAVTQAKRQPGSCFKPFVYMAALEQGLTGKTIIEDKPIEIYLGPSQGYYRPQNISKQSYGPTRLREGLELSRNQMTVNLAIKVGMKHISDLAIRFGVYNRAFNELAVSLGSAETTLLELTAAYGMIANGGKKITPYFINSVQDQQGKIVYETPINLFPILDIKDPLIDIDPDIFDENKKPRFFDNRPEVTQPNVANDMISFLEGAVQRGTARRLKPVLEEKNISFCAKTGTTNECKDGWCIGFTKNLKHQNLVIGTFIGYPTPKSMGENATGARTALPLISQFLKNLPPRYLK